MSIIGCTLVSESRLVSEKEDETFAGLYNRLKLIKPSIHHGCGIGTPSKQIQLKRKK